MNFTFKIYEYKSSDLNSSFNGKPIVMFFDADYKNDPNFDGYGQFVSSYFVSTLIENKKKLEKYGLCLDGGIPEWLLTGEQMKDFFIQLDNM